MNCVGNYELFDKIGQGAFATVWEARNLKTNCPCAAKQFRKDVITPEMEICMQREISIMQNLDHPLIAQLYEVVDREDGTFLFMEYVDNGTLLEYINANAPINENRARTIFAQIVAVLDYLHNMKRVVHRDIKAENILIDENDNIRLIDFGLSNILNYNTVLYTACGSSAYAAPEMLRNQPYTQAADIWSVGVLLYAMTAAKLPFHDCNVTRLVEKILTAPPEMPVSFSDALSDLISRMLTKDPKQRITLEGIKRHPWFISDTLGAEITYDFSVFDKYKIIPHPPNIELDEEVLDRLDAFGVNYSHLKEDLLLNKMTEATAAYKSIFKELFLERSSLLENEMLHVTSKPLSLSAVAIKKRVTLCDVQPAKNATDTRLDFPKLKLPNGNVKKIPSGRGGPLINLIVPNTKSRTSLMKRPSAHRLIVFRN